MVFLLSEGYSAPRRFSRQSIVSSGYAQLRYVVERSICRYLPQTNQARMALPSARFLIFRICCVPAVSTAAFVGRCARSRDGCSGFDRGFDVFDALSEQLGSCGCARNCEISGRPRDQVLSGTGDVLLWIHCRCDASAERRTSFFLRSWGRHGMRFGKLVAELRMRSSLKTRSCDSRRPGEVWRAWRDSWNFLYDETITTAFEDASEQLAGKRVKGRVRLLDIAPDRARNAVSRFRRKCRDSRCSHCETIRCRSCVRAERFSQEAFGGAL